MELGKLFLVSGVVAGWDNFGHCAFHFFVGGTLLGLWVLFFFMFLVFNKNFWAKLSFIKNYQLSCPLTTFSRIYVWKLFKIGRLWMYGGFGKFEVSFFCWSFRMTRDINLFLNLHSRTLSPFSFSLINSVLGCGDSSHSLQYSCSSQSHYHLPRQQAFLLFKILILTALVSAN